VTPEEAERRLREAMKAEIDEALAEVFASREQFRAYASLEPISATNLISQVPDHCRQALFEVYDMVFSYWQGAITKRALSYETLNTDEVERLQGEALQHTLDACIEYVRGARILGLTKTPPPGEDDTDSSLAYSDDDDED
jgi:hypothetical protein